MTKELIEETDKEPIKVIEYEMMKQIKNWLKKCVKYQKNMKCAKNQINNYIKNQAKNWIQNQIKNQIKN